MVITKAGLAKFLSQRTMTYLRRPDMFDMCIYNDFYSYGILEVLENLLLDYVEAEGNWKEQWDVCQTIAWFLLDHSSEPMQMYVSPAYQSLPSPPSFPPLTQPPHRMDDSDRLDATIQLAGRVFLSMLALLGTKDLFTPTSQIKDFGLVMALNMKAGRSYRDDISLLQGQSQAARFDNHVLAYAKKHFVPLVGASDIDDIATACNGAVKLPVAMQTKPDPWGSEARSRSTRKPTAGRAEGRARASRLAVTSMISWP